MNIPLHQDAHLLIPFAIQSKVKDARELRGALFSLTRLARARNTWIKRFRMVLLIGILLVLCIIILAPLHAIVWLFTRDMRWIILLVLVHAIVLVLVAFMAALACAITLQFAIKAKHRATSEYYKRKILLQQLYGLALQCQMEPFPFDYFVKQFALHLQVPPSSECQVQFKLYDAHLNHCFTNVQIYCK